MVLIWVFFIKQVIRGLGCCWGGQLSRAIFLCLTRLNCVNPLYSFIRVSASGTPDNQRRQYFAGSPGLRQHLFQVFFNFFLDDAYDGKKRGTPPGPQTHIVGQTGLVLEQNALMKGHNEIALEQNALMKGHNEIALEQNALMKGRNEIALEQNALMKGHNEIALEQNALMKGHNALMKGHNAIALEHNALMKGHNACKSLN
jgi:hemin uptake protein HemP